jgi:outer membrane beta-barrel protein
VFALALFLTFGSDAAAGSTGREDCDAPAEPPDAEPPDAEPPDAEPPDAEPPAPGGDEAALPPAADPEGPPDPAAPSVPPDSAPVPAPAPEVTAAEALGRMPKKVKCLDESLIDESGRARRREGVQPRRFRKARRVAVSIGGGGWAGDLLDTSWHAHGNVAFWPTEGFGIDVDFKLTPMTYRLERSATDFTGQNRYPDGVVENFAYVGMAHVLFAPLHTKQRAREDRIAHGDFVLFAGGGRAFHPSTQGIGFDVGMSLYWYVARFVSLRIDVSDVILAQEVFGSRRISNNLVFSTGVGLWIPFRRKE